MYKLLEGIIGVEQLVKLEAKKSNSNTRQHFTAFGQVQPCCGKKYPIPTLQIQVGGSFCGCGVQLELAYI